MDQPAQMPPPGWYPDPDDPTKPARYWDGTGWPTQPPHRQALSVGQVVLIISVVLGSLLMIFLVGVAALLLGVHKWQQFLGVDKDGEYLEAVATISQQMTTGTRFEASPPPVGHSGNGACLDSCLTAGVTLVDPTVQDLTVIEDNLTRLGWTALSEPGCLTSVLETFKQTCEWESPDGYVQFQSYNPNEVSVWIVPAVEQ